ncbi:MAG: glycosyltransferase family 4 protein [Pseudomonadota bacterium]
MSAQSGATTKLGTRAVDSHLVRPKAKTQPRIVLFSNTSWYLYNFRRQLLERLRDSGFSVVLLSPKDDYTDALVTAGFEWHEFKLDRRSVNPLSQVGVLVRLWRAFRSLKPDVVHLFTVKCVVLGGIASRIAGVPRRVHAIAGLGSVFSDSHRRALRAAVSFALRLATAGSGSAIIVQNPDDAKRLQLQGIAPPDRIHLVRGSGVDGQRFHMRRDRTKEQRVRVLFAARLLKAKGVQDFVRIAKRTQTPDVEFLIAGERDPGNPDSVDESFLQHCTSVKNLRLLGHVDDMVSLLQSTSLVVLPSSYGEGVPRTLVESAAASLPLVAYDVPGSREIIVDGHNGFLCPVGDFEALAAAVQQLIADPQLRERYSKASREHFETEYDEKTVNRKTLDIYRHLGAAGTAC